MTWSTKSSTNNRTFKMLSALMSRDCNWTMIGKIPVDQKLSWALGYFLHISLQYLTFTAAVLHCSQKSSLINMSELSYCHMSSKTLTDLRPEASGMIYSKWAPACLRALTTMPRGLCTIYAVWDRCVSSMLWVKINHNKWKEITQSLKVSRWSHWKYTVP